MYTYTITYIVQEPTYTYIIVIYIYIYCSEIDVCIRNEEEEGPLNNFRRSSDTHDDR